MARRLSLAVGLLAIAVALAVALAQGAERRSGTDLTPNGAFVISLRPSETACQGDELVPADTAAVRLTIGTYGAPGVPLRVSITDAAGRAVTDGRLAAGWRQGIVRIGVRKVDRASQGNRFCLSNEGPITLAVAGDKPDPGYEMTLGGRKLTDVRLRVDYMRPGRETWFQVAPVIAHRFSLAKADWLRHWAWAAYLLLTLGAISLAAAILLDRRAEPGS